MCESWVSVRAQSEETVAVEVVSTCSHAAGYTSRLVQILRRHSESKRVGSCRARRGEEGGEGRGRLSAQQFLGPFVLILLTRSDRHQPSAVARGRRRSRGAGEQKRSTGEHRGAEAQGSRQMAKVQDSRGVRVGCAGLYCDGGRGTQHGNFHLSVGGPRSRGAMAAKCAVARLLT